MGGLSNLPQITLVHPSIHSVSVLINNLTVKFFENNLLLLNSEIFPE